jgi:hypothetical protein
VHVKKLECYRDLAFLPDEFEAEVKTAINKMNAGFFKGRVVEDSDGRRIQFVALDGAQSTFVRQIVKGQLRVVDALERVTTETKNMQLLYEDGDGLVFMDGETYEQVTVPKSDIE